MQVDPLAQLVEHNTFNVGVLGSSPKRITHSKGLHTPVKAFAFLSRLYYFATKAAACALMRRMVMERGGKVYWNWGAKWS